MEENFSGRGRRFRPETNQQGSSWDMLRRRPPYGNDALPQRQQGETSTRPPVDLLRTMALERNTYLSDRSTDWHQREYVSFFDGGESEKRIIQRGGEIEFNKIMRTRPMTSEHRAWLNAASRNEHALRYDTEPKKVSILRHQSPESYTFIKTFVKGFDLPCYAVECDSFGIFEEKESYKTRPEREDLLPDGRLPYGQGAVDSEAKKRDSTPSYHSSIMHNQIEAAGIIPQEWRCNHIIEPETRKIIDLFLGVHNNQTTSPVSRTFRAGEDGYYGMVYAPVGRGKWFLAAHHYGMDIPQVKIQRRWDVNNEKMVYRATFTFSQTDQ